MTTVRLNPASPSTPVPRRTWLGVLSLALGAAIIVTTELTPVGFLPDVAGDLDVSFGAAATPACRSARCSSGSTRTSSGSPT
jgi:predicted MFS family arabinose efflux permease